MSKRRFFQIHLSTAVLLMLVAGVLVWANVRERILWEDENCTVYINGWPFDYRYHERVHMWGKVYDGPAHDWSVGNTLFNSLIALAILLAVWQVCEWLIRRTSSQKSP